MLNIPRLVERSADAVMKGIEYARGGQLPFSLFDAVALSEEEAAVRQSEVNERRLAEELLRESRRWG